MSVISVNSLNKFIILNIILVNFLSSQMGDELNLTTTETKRCVWTRQSDELLRNVEKKILSCLKTTYKSFYKNIGPVVGKDDDKIWTISLNEGAQKTPLVMLHGMGAGLALWCPNLDALAASRPVYAIDLLGFGRSSRPKFSTDPLKAEAQWVESIEAWRREVDLPQFILLGHSLGGYISTLYAMKYPERVRHLIAADPWGYSERTPEIEARFSKLPLWMRAIASVVQMFNPLSMLRAAGPAGQWLVTRGRSDIAKKYNDYIPDAETVIPEYIYQCNSQTPSGEAAFHTLMSKFALAKNPLIRRFEQLHPALPVTEIYGARSWVPRCTEAALAEARPAGTRYPKVIQNASHHVYLDRPDVFNEFVLEACVRADEYDPKIEPQMSVDTNHNAADNTAKLESLSQQNNNVRPAQSQQNNNVRSAQSLQSNVIPAQSQPVLNIINQHDNL